MRRFFSSHPPNLSDPVRNRHEKKAPGGAFQDNCFYYNFLELVTDADNSSNLVRRRGRRQAVYVCNSGLAGRIRTQRVLIDAVDVQVGALGQEVVRANDALVLLRVV